MSIREAELEPDAICGDDDNYKCGHGHKPVFLKNSVVAFCFYEEWRQSVGFDGDNSMCFPCYCKEAKKRRINEQEPV